MIRIALRARGGVTPMNLSTQYLGLQLAHPFMPGASPLADGLDTILRLEDAGASAIVMRSLFQEQIAWHRFDAAHRWTDAEFPPALKHCPSPEEFAIGPERYVSHLARIKRRVGIPVIASLNGTTADGWLEYARVIERGGADALELNFYHIVSDPMEDSLIVERRIVDIVAVLKESLRIPVAVKLSPFYSSLPNLVAQLNAIGADGLVLFNRFCQPDIDPEALQLVPRLQLSDSSELLLRLRWLAILSGRVRTSLAASGGVHEPLDAVKAVMAGADAVQLVSALLRHGPEHLGRIRHEFERWGDAHGYASIDEMRGRMSLSWCRHPEHFERGLFVRMLQSWRSTPPIAL
jgi:dihydroorotate dehydrogenase (fumarate)